MYAITGTKGNVGGSVAHNLLAAGRSVRAVVRDIGKGNVWAERGCEVVTADITDRASGKPGGRIEVRGNQHKDSFRAFECRSKRCGVDGRLAEDGA
jgi:uncharacterized protein YbjT (DUF2867 family)